MNIMMSIWRENRGSRAWLNQYSYNQLQPLYLGLVNPKKIVWGNINQVTPDHLITTSKELCEKFVNLLETPFQEDTIGNYE
jgi:hypothetical protein